MYDNIGNVIRNGKGAIMKVKILTGLSREPTKDHTLDTEWQGTLVA